MQSGNVYVFIGASGSGKSTIAKAITEAQPDRFAIVKKISNRPMRPGDEDIISANDIDLRGNTRYLAYLTNGEKTYCIDMLELKSDLARGVSLLLVVNNPMTIAVLRRIVRDVVVVFIHRDMTTEDLRCIFMGPNRGLTGEDLERSLAARQTARSVLYNHVAAGVIEADHIIINDTIANATQQFLSIADCTSRQDIATPDQSVHVPALSIIVAGTGVAKDHAIRMIETIPGGSRFIIPKYVTRARRADDGPETITTDRIPGQCHTYRFFGNEYGVDPATVRATLEQFGFGVVTISNIERARIVERMVQQWGMEAHLVYLHQRMPELGGYDPEEARLRTEHWAALLRLYQTELVALPRLPVILAEDLDVLCAFMQRLCMQAPTI